MTAMQSLLTLGAPSTTVFLTVVIVIAAIVLLVVLAFLGRFIGLWIQATVSNARVGLTSSSAPPGGGATTEPRGETFCE